MHIHLSRLTEEKSSAHALRYAMIYIGFLLVCLGLGLVIALSAANNAKNKYWAYHATNLELDISHTDSDLSMMENYARQLSTDSTFVRFSNMNGLDDPGFVFTAYQIMQNLSLRQYGLSELPVKSYIYLPRSGYVISSSQFSQSSQFYRYYLAYPTQLEDVWFGLLEHHGRLGTCFSLDAFGESPSDVALAYDIGALLTQPVPAIVWYELDTSTLRKRFLPTETADAELLITDENGLRQLILSGNGSLPGDAMLSDIADASYDQDGYAQNGDRQYIHRRGANGWNYYLSLPNSLSAKALGSFPLIYGMVFLSAILFGALLVMLLVHQSMKPLHELSHELSLAQSDNAQMRRAMEVQRPALCMTYLRALLSGHVASKEEFSYMMRFLGLHGEHQYFVLFGNAYRHDGGTADESEQHTLILEQMTHYLSGGLPLHHYMMPGREYVLLIAYPAAQSNALADLAARVGALHNALSEQYGLWFIAGCGLPCTQPEHLWEAYEQARSAYRYTAKTHFFLYYDDISKDSDAWYYPIEISAKLLHFITTGNSQQVSAMFALIHRENVEQRSLSMPTLSLLLSDLKNTLFKARFQIAQPDTEEKAHAVRQVHERLQDAHSFAELESIALSLCAFFSLTAEPSDPIPEVQRYLQENFADPSLCLSKLSGLFNISESYLSHLFKNRTGENFSSYLETLRMNEALRRLKQADCSLSTLYTELGYTNPTTWRRAFKKRFGMTPSEMMEQNK